MLCADIPFSYPARVVIKYLKFENLKYKGECESALSEGGGHYSGCWRIVIWWIIENEM